MRTMAFCSCMESPLYRLALSSTLHVAAKELLRGSFERLLSEHTSHSQEASLIAGGEQGFEV